MADLIADLRQHVLTHQPLRGTVGARVFPDSVPVGAELPALALSLTDDEPGETISGHSTLIAGRLRCDCIADRRGHAHTVADQVEDALVDYRGVIGVRQTHHLSGVSVANRYDRKYVPSGSDQWRYRTVLDLVFHYTRR